MWKANSAEQPTLILGMINEGIGYQWIFAIFLDRSEKHHPRNKKVIRESKIHVYRKRQTTDSKWEFFRIENKQVKTVPNDSYG